MLDKDKLIKRLKEIVEDMNQCNTDICFGKEMLAEDLIDVIESGQFDIKEETNG